MEVKEMMDESRKKKRQRNQIQGLALEIREASFRHRGRLKGVKCGLGRKTTTDNNGECKNSCP